jgi:hypothetical protein
MKPASSEHRNATAAATSAGWPRRFIGTARVIASITFAPWSPPPVTSASIAVSVGPGQTAFAVTPRRATSRAIVLVNAITPPFAPEYTDSSEEPTRPASEPMFTIRP